MEQETTSKEIINNYNNGNLDLFRKQINGMSLKERDSFIIDWNCEGLAHHDICCIMLKYLD